MTDAGGYIVPSRTSILETIPRVIATPPKLKPKSTTGALENAFFHFRAGMTSHPWLTLALLIGFVLGTGMYGRNRIRKVRGGWGSGAGFFQVGDGEKGLLNGGAAGGKVD